MTGKRLNELIKKLSRLQSRAYNLQMAIQDLVSEIEREKKEC